jgi:hypothetical protein
MKSLGLGKWLVLFAFLLTVLVTGMFAVRTVRRAVYWHNHRDEPIRAWMNVGYVARSYRVPPPVLYQAIGVDPQPHDRRPLREIARRQNRSVEAVILDLQNAIEHFRQSPPPQFPPPPPDRGKGP